MEYFRWEKYLNYLTGEGEGAINSTPQTACHCYEKTCYETQLWGFEPHQNQQRLFAPDATGGAYGDPRLSTW